MLLHDPAGNDAWEGTAVRRTARTEIDPEMANDPLLGEVGWSWLTEALTAHGAVPSSGTVTKVASESFGSMSEEGDRAARDPRRSWTPVGDISDHVEAWGDCSAPPRGSRRCRRASPRCPAAEDSAAAPDAPLERQHPAPAEDDSATGTSGAPEPEEVRAPLLELRDGLPPVIDTDPALAEAVELFGAGSARSRSTPSARPATATPPAPT